MTAPETCNTGFRMSQSDFLCRLTGSHSAVLRDVAAQHSPSRLTQAPVLRQQQQHVQQDGSSVHSQRLSAHQDRSSVLAATTSSADLDRPTPPQGAADPRQPGSEGQSEMSAQLVLAPSSSASRQQQPELPHACEVCRQESIEQAWGEHSAHEDPRQQQPVVLPRQQSSDVYHVHQPHQHAPSKIAQALEHDEKRGPSGVHQRLGKRLI